MTFPPELIARLRQARRVVVLTGAGVSQESGLRTFREAQTGLWSQVRPEDLATPEAFQRDPRRVWDWYATRRARLSEVGPNPAHLALAAMEKKIPDFLLITQNVDGLHARAGSERLVELHGNLARVRCADCGMQAEGWDDSEQPVPHCLVCGGLLRPDVVWFGEALPRPALETAVDAARACDVFFSIGTSGLVQPAASLAHAARNRGALLVEVNLEPTPLTARADFAFHGRAGDILPGLLTAVWE